MKQPLCCISHEFQRVALLNPRKIAVIHASGGLQLFRQLHGGDDSGGDTFFKERAVCAFPFMYEGDRCFTYSQLLASVDSLSSRLVAILRDRDPQFITPTAPHRGQFLNSTDFCSESSSNPLFRYEFMYRTIQFIQLKLW